VVNFFIENSKAYHDYVPSRMQRGSANGVYEVTLVLSGRIPRDPENLAGDSRPPTFVRNADDLPGTPQRVSVTSTLPSGQNIG
jgi:hypothetical protein